MALSEFDRTLLAACLDRQPGAWENFVDRFMGLVVHVVNHTAQARSIRLSDDDREDLTAEVFLALIREEFAVLRYFRGESSLATYLTVIARRVVVRQLLSRRQQATLLDGVTNGASHPPVEHHDDLQRLTNRDEVERLLESLQGDEAQAVRMYHLDGLSYLEIGSALGIQENSVGPLLSRARDKMRRSAV